MTICELLDKFFIYTGMLTWGTIVVFYLLVLRDKIVEQYNAERPS